MLRKLSDPFWFQALGCVLGFDWHSSGVTTTVCGALKEGIKGLEGESGLFIAGGKGQASRRTPAEIVTTAEQLSLDAGRLVYASSMAAKVDSAALQDGYQLYHHVFVFTSSGSWAVVQQGMNEENRYARRYHWLGEAVKDFVCEPHAAICAEETHPVLNLVAGESSEARGVIPRIASEEKPEKLVEQFKRLQTLEMPQRHHLVLQDMDPRRLSKTLAIGYEAQPADFEALLGVPGIGPRTIRALSLISKLVYGMPASQRDPARFSFAHGGKDGYPYPVDRKTYDKSIEVLGQALRRAKMGDREKVEALKRLARFQR